ncbi:MAG: hypothetical protein WB870_12465, partial [Gallionellaceae bacterium]
MHTDNGIDTLIDLNGNIVQQERGFWVEIHAWRVAPTILIPHGIRYSLTLHDRSGVRVLGYDNAHAAKPPGRFKYAGQILPYDHKHRHIADKGVMYDFKDAYQLLSRRFHKYTHVLFLTCSVTYSILAATCKRGSVYAKKKPVPDC